MESSVQTIQEIMEELLMLRERVAELEQAEVCRKQNEQALQEASQRMDEFLSIVSHELRTPLTTINGNIQLARRRLRALIPDTTIEESSQEMSEFNRKLEFVQELLNRAERQVQVQNRIVGDLLDVSRIQSNRLELHMEECNLVALVREAVENQRSAAPTRTITLLLPTTPTISVYADPMRIGQVVTNYLTNALKYSAADRPVLVELVVKDANQARLSVHDEGPGLTQEELVHLWQRFYRVPGIYVQSGTGVGLGLGLYICHIIIEHHLGTVGVESEVGKGSTFWFTLPVTSASIE